MEPVDRDLTVSQGKLPDTKKTTLTEGETPQVNEVAKQQAERPTTFKHDVLAFVNGPLRTAAALGSIALGVTAGIVLLPITLPFGVIGGGLGLLAGKAAARLKPDDLKFEQKAMSYGVQAGLSIGTLGTAALALAGIHLLTHPAKKPEVRAQQKTLEADVKKELHREVKENLDDDMRLAVDSMKGFLSKNIDDITQKANAELETYPDYKKQMQDVTVKLKEIETKLESVASSKKALENKKKEFESQPKMDILDDYKLNFALKPNIEDAEGKILILKSQIQDLKLELEQISQLKSKEDKSLIKSSEKVETKSEQIPSGFIFKNQKGLQANLTNLEKNLREKLTEESINDSIKILNKLPFDPRKVSISKDKMNLLNLIRGGLNRKLEEEELETIYQIINDGLNHIR